ncbi:MAG: adenylyltransferase/cytidyltransferase family protein, partial [Jiangellaceae bacterium]
MTIWHAPEEVPADLGPAVVTIGVFDGVHRGHQAVVGRAGEHARKRGLPLVVVTFDPNPIAVIRP